jgi:formate dehydrogenase maturation protein FdhE
LLSKNSSLPKELGRAFIKEMDTSSYGLLLEHIIKKQESLINELKEEASSRDEDLDEIQQYSRRDCIEIVGIPRLPRDNPRKLFKELCSLIDIELEDHEISTVHRLPDTKKTKNRMIAKLVRRDMKDRIYQSKKKLVGKTTRTLPSVNTEPDKYRSQLIHQRYS